MENYWLFFFPFFSAFSFTHLRCLSNNYVVARHWWVFISLSMLIREEIGVRVRGGNENERAQI
jgi:hypothetical protein